MGYINPTGSYVITPRFEAADIFQEGLAAIAIDHKIAYINKAGNIAITGQYYFTTGNIKSYRFSEGLAAFDSDRRSDNNSIGYINNKGQVAIRPAFFEASPFSEGLAAVRILLNMMREPDKCGYVDHSGKFVIHDPVWRNGIQSFRGGLAGVRDINDSWGFVDRQGNKVIPLKYRAYRIGPFSEGLAPIQYGYGHVTYIDKSGNAVIDFGPFTAGGPFSEGLANVRLVNGKWGYIDRDRNIVIAPEFTGAEAFFDGLAKVWIGDAFGYINRTGRYVWPPQK